MQKTLNIKIAGKAGEGIKVTGLILSRYLSRLGFDIFAYDEYPSLIRGGHNTFQVYAAPKALSHHEPVDILVAFDMESVGLHQNEVVEGGFIIAETSDVDVSTLLTVPLRELATQAGGSGIMANMVALGAVAEVFSLPLDPLSNLLEEVFEKKGDDVIRQNQQTVRAGSNYIKDKFSQLKKEVEISEKHPSQVLSGNEAISLGAISAGMKYFASYPMTPASSILHFLAEYAQKKQYVVNHAENEIAAINTVLGASASGLRAMTATSGGGFSLMVEALGMAGIAEIPAVVVLSSRPGPATGMPTWTGQADLRYAIHASQDEFPRVVFTPGTVKEAFQLTRKAFEISEKYQLPVILLVDKYLSESLSSVQFEATTFTNQRHGFIHETPVNYHRYEDTEHGVSRRPQLGQKMTATMLANSYEHDESGLSTEAAGQRVVSMDKRMRKLQALQADIDAPVVIGNPEKLLLVGFGSSYGPVAEALKKLPQVGYLHFHTVWPFPSESREILKHAPSLASIEGNATGQLAGIIREHTGIEITQHIRAYDGRPFSPELIEKEIAKYL